MSADTPPQARSCECPGCKQRVRVTAAGRMFEHKRPTNLVVDFRGEPTGGKLWCRWSGKPAPTERTP